MTTFTITTHYRGHHSMIVSVQDENQREIAATEAFTLEHAKHIAYGYAVLVTKTRADDSLVLDTSVPERPEN
ncbi:MAG: hypothetical protein JWN69_269 [Alphaproteobacteria bacterium]|nr:hypothetical protein [Alphaproteobacteria bacterium]